MPARTILQWPDKTLMKVSEPIQDFGEDLRSLAQDLWDTVQSHAGAGLAAPQFGTNKRVAVIVPGALGIPNPDPCVISDDMFLLVNPRLELSGKKIRWKEACLSVPIVDGMVERNENLVLTYNRLDGSENTLEISWPLSGVIQHECDHLDGKLFLDRVSWMARDRLRKKILKRIKKIREEHEEDQKILRGIEAGWVEEDQTKAKIGRPKNRKKKNRKQYGKLKKRKKR